MSSCLPIIRPIQIEVKASNGYPVHNLDTGLNYTTIQEAIDAPQTSNGHTISVEEGIYYENVIVDKSVSIVAENRTNTIIDGNGTGTVFRIVRDATNITGLVIRESGGWPEACIFLNNVRDCSVSANVVENNNKTSTTFVGIFLYSSERNMITGNDVRNNVIGMNVLLSSNNTIKENHVANAHLGIQTSNSSNGNVIFENSLTDCDYGITLNHEVQYNIIAQNQIEYSSEVGVAIETASHNNSDRQHNCKQLQRNTSLVEFKQQALSQSHNGQQHSSICYRRLYEPVG